MTNIPSWLAALGVTAPPVTGLLGYLLAGKNEEARDKRTALREDTARRAALQERLASDRQAFQREVLLELQDVLLLVVRGANKFLMTDMSTLRSTGTLTILPTDLSDETYEAGVRFTRIRERVLDGTLRERLKEFHEFVSTAELLAIGLKDQPAATALPRFEATQRELAMRYQEVSDRLGESLREILGG